MTTKMNEEETINAMPWSMMQSYYFGEHTRTITLWGEITDHKVLSVMDKILWLESINNEPIILSVNTVGGDVPAAFALYDCIRRVQCKVVVVTTGFCGSAGLLILASGDVRIASPLTRFFYHELIQIREGEINSLEANNGIAMSYSNDLKLYNKMLKERMSIDKDDWKRYFKRRTYSYFNAEEAKRFGLIHSILKNKEDRNGKSR